MKICALYKSYYLNRWARVVYASGVREEVRVGVLEGAWRPAAKAKVISILCA